MKTRPEIQSKQSILIFTIGKAITNNLDFTFDFSNFHYLVISTPAKITIESEVNKALGSLTLTDTQAVLLDNLTPEDLKMLAASIAGSLETSGRFNIASQSGIYATGLTKHYFDCLSIDIKELAGNAVMGYSIINSTARRIISMDPDEKHYVNATHDQLKGSFEEREKKIVSSFCSEIARFATEKQLSLLCTELQQKDNQPINKLRETRGIRSLIVSESSSTKSYESYEHKLFSQAYCWKMLGTMLRSISSCYDAVGYIGFFLNRHEKDTLRKALPCVNKEIATLAESEEAEFKKTYRRV